MISKIKPPLNKQILDEKFGRWLDEPLMRIAMSQIPPMPDNLLVTLLRAAFEAGTEFGIAALLLDLLEQVKQTKPEK